MKSYFILPKKNSRNWNIFFLFLIVLNSVIVNAQTDNCTNITPFIEVNNTCTNPFPFSIGENFNNTGPTPCEGNNYRDGWFRFTTDQNTNFINLNLTSSTGAGVALYSGACGNLTEILCSVPPNSTELTLTNYQVTPNTTYYLRIMRTTTGTSNMTGSVCITRSFGAVPISGTRTYSMCTGVIYDSGGSNQNYSNNSNGETRIFPSILGNKVQVSGLVYTATQGDKLEIFDGEGTNGPLLWDSTTSQQNCSIPNIVPTLTSSTGPLTIRFVTNSTNTCSGFTILVGCVGCLTPSNLAVDYITSNSAQISWNAPYPRPQLGYEYYYNSTGTPPTASTNPTGSTGPGVVTRNLNNLTPDTVYHYWVRTNCHSTNKGEWVYGGYFNTLPPRTCRQGNGQINGEVFNGLRIKASENYRVANKFSVTDNYPLFLDYITLDVMSYSPIISTTINIRADINNSPGAIIHTVWNNAPPTSSSQPYTSYSSYYNLYHLTYVMPAPKLLEGGNYWLEVTMENQDNTEIYWRSYESSNTVGVNFTSTNSGNTWSDNIENVETMFYVAGNCSFCNNFEVQTNFGIVCQNQEVTLSIVNPGSNTYTWYENYNTTTQTGTLLGTGNFIKFAPQKSSLYYAVSNCGKHDFIPIAVIPEPSIVVPSPFEVEVCQNEQVIHELSVTGGELDNTILSKTFEPNLSKGWHMYASVSGSDYRKAFWKRSTSPYKGISSNDASSFIIVDSEAFGNYEMESSYISPIFSLEDYIAPISLNFYQYYRHKSPQAARIEISENGGQTWTVLQTYTANVGQPTNFVLTTISLNAYAGKPNLIIRFRLNATNGYYWAIDNINMVGTPKPIKFFWTPTTGLYLNAAATTPYTGGSATTLYAMPENSTTYTVTATRTSSCTRAASVDVFGGYSIWDGANWVNNITPNNNRKLVVKGNFTTSADMNACSLVVQNGDFLVKSGNSLVIENGISIDNDLGSLTIESDANLIQNTAGAINTGEITVKREAIVPSNQYNYWASPVIDQDLYELYPNIPANRIMTYNTATDFFNTMPVGTLSQFGKGYSIKGPTSNSPENPNGNIGVSADFVGVPQNESLTASQNEIILSNLGNGYNLIGNPYPSNLDLDLLYSLNGNSSQFTQEADDSHAYYFWDNVGNTAFTQMGPEYENYTYNNYATYNPNSGIGTVADNANGSGKIPNGIVKPGQGFIIRANTSLQNPKLTLSNEMRTKEIRHVGDTTDAPYYKNDGVQLTTTNNSKPRSDKFWLELINPDQIHVQIAIGYFNSAENNFEKFDSPVMNDQASDLIYSISSDSRKLNIQGRKGPLDTEDIIPLGVKTFKEGVYTIKLAEKLGIFKNHQNIYIKDNLLNFYHNLSESDYAFSIDSGHFANRFELVFKIPEQSIDNPELTTANQIKIQKVEEEIKITSTNQKISEVEVFNLAGWRIFKMDELHKLEYKIPSTPFGKQILFVKVKTETGEIHNQKIIN